MHHIYLELFYIALPYTYDILHVYMIHAIGYIIEFMLATLVATILFISYVFTTFRIRTSFHRALKHFKDDMRSHRLDNE